MRSQVCDGKKDCFDGIDEENCPGSCTIEAFFMNTKLITCSDGKQYTEAEACFVKKTAQQNATRSLLLSTCPSNERAEKKCIKRSKLCGGVFDCEDGSDEKDCTPKNECRVDNASQFTCDRKCIDVSHRCDGVWDFENKTDEKNCVQCPSGFVRCAADKTCLPASTRRNGVAECPDGSDEQKCSCEECLGAHSNTYMCNESNRCLKRDEVCPHATYTDKAYCASLILKNSDRFPN